MSHWWCCCGCFQDADNFNRADSTALGTKWTEAAPDGDGSWEISGLALIETTGTGRVIFDPHKNAYAIVTIQVYEVAVGDVYSLYLQYHDADNYLRAEWTFDDANSYTVRHYRCATGTETLLDTCADLPWDGPTEDAWFNLKSCAGKYWWSSDYSLINTPIDDDTDTDARTGVGHDSGRQVVFDNWSYSEHYDSNTACPNCGFCKCDETHETPLRLTATYIGYNEGCWDMSGLTGATVQLEAANVSVPGNLCSATQWGGWAAAGSQAATCYPPRLSGGTEYPVYWLLQCPTLNPENLANWQLGMRARHPTTLALIPTGHGDDHVPTWRICDLLAGTLCVFNANPELSTCHPLSLVFDVDVTFEIPARPFDCPGEPDGETAGCPCVTCDCETAESTLQERVHFRIIVTETPP